MTTSAGKPLARSLAPLPDESVSGFLLRLSHRLGLAPIRVAELAGLSSDAQRIRADHLLALPDTEPFALATRLSTSEARALTLSSYIATYPPLRKILAHTSRNAASQRDTWSFSHSSRYCPECLAGDGSPIQASLGGPWKLRWHLPAVFACTLHRRLLESACPACHNPLGGCIRGRGNLIRLPARGGLHPLQCRNAPFGGQPTRTSSRIHPSCGERLDTTPRSAGTALPPRDLTRLLDLQDRLNQALDPHPLSSAENTCQKFYFPDLIIVRQLIKVGWPAASPFAPSATTAALLNEHIEPITTLLESRPTRATASYLRIPDLWAAPDDAAQCGALLLTAETVLGDRDPASLRERIRPLIDAAYDRAPGRTYKAIRSAEFSPKMARAMVRRARSTFHHGSEQSRLFIPSRDCLFTTEEVPPLLPQDWFDAQFTGFIERIINTTNWTGRHCAEQRLSSSLR